jgi:hypothetical protein
MLLQKLFLQPGAMRNLLGRPLSTGVALDRYHRDHVENRKLWRYGYVDKVMKSGALPRLDNDGKKIEGQMVFRPSNPFAPSVALYGQNDYIDILGDDDSLHVTETHYHIPQYLRGLKNHKWHYKILIKQRQTFAESGMPQAFPLKWGLWDRNTQRYKTHFKKRVNQKWWANYDGLKFGDVPNPYKTRYPF